MRAFFRESTVVVFMQDEKRGIKETKYTNMELIVVLLTRYVSGFDPWDESVKALADMMEKEGVLEKIANKNTKNGFVNNLTGFDPWDESSKALADLIEKEGTMPSFPAFNRANPNPPPGLHNHMQPPPTAAAQHPSLATPVAAAKNVPPGLTTNHIGAYNSNVPPPPSGRK